MESIMCRNPELEASFSFNSALHVFSDDDDEGDFIDDEYIEIELQQQHKIGDGDESREQLELRVSFSSSYHNDITAGLSWTSTVKSLGGDWETATTTTTIPTSSSSLSTSTLSCSSPETCLAVDHQRTSRTQKAVKWRVQIQAVNRLLNGFLSTPMTSSEHVSRDETFDESRQVEIHTKMNQLDLLRSRKADAKMTKATNGGMMMKFLVKCRSINIRAVLASFMKPYQIIISSSSSSPQSNIQKIKKRSCKEKTSTIRTCQSLLVKPFDKWLVQREKLPNHEDNIINYYCPSSINYSLPIQQGFAGDSCSIQSAIAHCKRSFGQTSEFHF